MTEALVSEHGRTTGCPRCSQRRMPWTDRRNSDATKPYEAEPRGGRTTTKAVTCSVKKPLDASDVEKGVEDSCEAQVKRAKTIMDLEICVLGAQGDIHDETPGTLTNPAETSGENATDEDVVAPEVTEDLNRLKTLGRAHKALSVDEPMPLRYLNSQKTNERLDDRMVAEGRDRELSTSCSQDALFVIPRTAPTPRRFVAGSLTT